MEVSIAMLRERMQPTLEMVGSLVKIEQAYINTSHPDFFTAGPAFQAVARIVEERRRRDFEVRMSRSGSQSVSEEALQVLPITTAPSPPTMAKDRDGGLFSYLFKSQSPHAQTAMTTAAVPIVQSTPPSLSPVQFGHTPKKRQAGETHPTLSEREEFETQLIMTLLHSYFAIVKRNLADSVPKATMHFLVNHLLDQLPTRLIAELYKEEMFGELLREDEAIVRQRARCRTDLEALQQALNIIGEIREIVE